MRAVPLFALIALAAPAMAQDHNAADSKKPEKKLCRSVAATGSILGGKRECHTKAEWEMIAEQAREERDSRGNGMLGGAGAGVSRGAQ